MKERLPWVFDGEDFTKEINRHGYSIHYEKREGVNGGMMLDGSLTVDVLGWKAVLQLPVNDLPAEKYSKLVNVCMKEYVRVNYFDVRQNAVRDNVEFIPTLEEGTLKLISGSGTHWYHGMMLTLQEK